MLTETKQKIFVQYFYGSEKQSHFKMISKTSQTLNEFIAKVKYWKPGGLYDLMQKYIYIIKGLFPKFY